MTSRRLHALGLFLALALPACSTTRGPNYLVVAGVDIASATPPAGTTQSHMVGGVGAIGELVPENDDFTKRGRVAAAFGGGGAGLGGRASLLLEAGPVAFGGDHHLFTRAGFAGTIERDPATGLFALELPTLTAGYQFQGHGTQTFLDSMHFDIGPRVGLDVVSRAFAGPLTDDAKAKPEAGASMLLMGEYLTVELSYMHVGKQGSEEIFRSLGCFALGLAFCAETRHVLAPFGGPSMPRTWTGYVGITIGLGMATGLQHHSAL
jgi:hypothetical protein